MEIASSDEWYRIDDTGQRLILTLHIQPGARRTEVVGPHGDALKIKLAAPPVEGAANAALLAFLAGVFGVPQRQVILRQGARSRRKIVEIRNALRGREGLLK
ncbi:MAG TPA: DUF167 family protein [Nitrosospira sp.]|nr:DUF167 family protein [Nitrosospira sp.]